MKFTILVIDDEENIGTDLLRILKWRTIQSVRLQTAGRDLNL